VLIQYKIEVSGFLIILVLILNSCSVIGLSTGLVIDGVRDDFVIFDIEKLDNLSKNRELSIITADSSISGKFDSVLLISDSLVSFYNDNGTFNIPMRDIKQVEIKQSKNVKWYGFGIGLVMDIILVYVFITDPPNIGGMGSFP